MAKNKGLSSQKTGQIGVNIVERIVLLDWKCRWQIIDAHNDDGADGLIFVEEGYKTNGQIIYVQIKHRILENKNIENLHLQENKNIYEGKARFWRGVAGAFILIYVCNNGENIFWVNLKDEGNWTEKGVRVSKKNIFNKASKSIILRMCGTYHIDQNLPSITLDSSDFRYLETPNSTLKASWEFYKNELRGNISIGGVEVLFNRLGWRHITRRERSVMKRLQSLFLLGVLRKSFSVVTVKDLRQFSSKRNLNKLNYNLVYFRVFVKFNFRQSCVVSIVLRHVIFEGKDYYTFYTIYESRRGRNVLGEK